MGIRTTLAAFALTASLLATGCATYVNIPSREGDVAVHDPNEGAVQRVEIAAGRAAIAERRGEGQFQVVLPRGTSPLTYDQVLPKISPDAVHFKDGPREGVAVVEIREIRIRGMDAEADVVRPWDLADPSGYSQVLTVEMKWDPVGLWQVVRVTGWRTDVDSALRTTPYAPVQEGSR